MNAQTLKNLLERLESEGNNLNDITLSFYNSKNGVSEILGFDVDYIPNKGTDIMFLETEEFE